MLIIWTRNNPSMPEHTIEFERSETKRKQQKQADKCLRCQKTCLVFLQVNVHFQSLHLILWSSCISKCFRAGLKLHSVCHHIRSSCNVDGWTNASAPILLLSDRTISRDSKYIIVFLVLCAGKITKCFKKFKFRIMQVN